MSHTTALSILSKVRVEAFWEIYCAKIDLYSVMKLLFPRLQLKGFVASVKRRAFLLDLVTGMNKKSNFIPTSAIICWIILTKLR